ncbi:hypothetical protein K804_06735 [Salmonella enterica subsp. enterica serovar Newport str. SHSN014]|nr:hypothetical protein K804_06735 [Salmonella enterica subsp. enterica serovar Newport str. SHSN014]
MSVAQENLLKDKCFLYPHFVVDEMNNWLKKE